MKKFKIDFLDATPIIEIRATTINFPPDNEGFVLFLDDVDVVVLAIKQSMIASIIQMP